MDFDDTPEEAAFRGEVRAWLEANAEPLGPSEAPRNILEEALDAEACRAAREWQAKKADGGWACLDWPEEYGGRGATPIQCVIWRQEEARFRTPPEIFITGQTMLAPALMAHGSDEQKRRYLEKMRRGEEVWCQLFSEPAAGSDLAGIRTSAVRDGDGWIINGQKTWATFAQFARWGLIVTRTDPGAAKHAGITNFIVDMGSPGVEVLPIRQMNRATAFNDVFFTDVRVHRENMVGRENDGWRGVITTLMNERASIAALQQSDQLEALVRLARETGSNGRPAIEDAWVRQQVAEFYVKLTALRYTGYRVLTALSRGATPGPQSSLGKLVGARLGQQLAGFACDLQGVCGAVAEGGGGPDAGFWQDAYLAAPGGRLGGGTDEILRNVIAERVLGLPADPRVDKGVPFRELPTGPGAKR
jgi:acyl-CoA dehydrogenase